MQETYLAVAFDDYKKTLQRIALVNTLGWQDVKQRYRRSALGPFWLTISMGVMIGTIGLVFGGIFKTPMHAFLPFLAVGIILWGYISTAVNEGCMSFIAAESIIKQLPIPLFVHVLRVLWRNTLILFHNAVIFPLVLLFAGSTLGWVSFYAIPGMLLVMLNLIWVSLLFGMICTRYRDLPQIVISVMQVVFYLTPIVWSPSQLSGRHGFAVLNLNPVFHLMEVVRAPLLGNMPSQLNWVVSLALAVCGWAVTTLVYGRYKRRIAYWL